MRFLKEPLLHFVALGMAIFAGYAWLSDGGSARHIVVTRGQQNSLIASFERAWQRPPAPEEFNGLLRDFIRQEIAYREADQMELDRNDIVIQRRLRQKLELLTEDLAAMAPPTGEELDAWYREHAESYRTEPRYSFEQIFFSTDIRGDRARGDLVATLAALESGSGSSDAIEAGDAISLPQRLRDAPRFEIEATFGHEFADALETLPTDAWSGPVKSGFGLHLVRISQRVESRIPALAEVEQRVSDDLLADRRRRAVDALYERLAANYTITVEPLDAPQG